MDALSTLRRTVRLSLNKGRLRRIIHFVCRGHCFRRKTIVRYLRDQAPRRLQIGGGYHTRNRWLNGDIIAGDIYLDARKRFPFPDQSVDFVFAEQFIEHLSFEHGRKFLEECCRVLKDRGRIRLATPDMRGLLELLDGKNSNVDLREVMERHRRLHNAGLTTPCHFLNDYFTQWGHAFIYDEETLRVQLEQAGFCDCARHSFGCSSTTEFVNLERHADVNWMKSAYVLILEGRKR